MNTQLTERPATIRATAPRNRSRPAPTEPEGSRPSRPTRRPGHRIALIIALLVVGSAIAIVSAVTDIGSTTDPVAIRPEFDSPGGNSVGVPSPTPGPQTRPEFDGPGGSPGGVPSPTPGPQTRPTHDSPGGNSVGVHTR